MPWPNLPDARDRRRDLRPVRRSSRWCSRRRPSSSSRRARRSSAARISASCASSRAGTGSTSTSSRSRSPGIDQGFFRPRQTIGAPQAVLNVNMGAETNVAGFARPLRHDAADVGASPQGSTRRRRRRSRRSRPCRCSRRWGSSRRSLRVLPPPVVRPAETGLVRTAELQAYAQGIADALELRASSPQGRRAPDVGVLRPGGLVAVRGAGPALQRPLPRHAGHAPHRRRRLLQTLRGAPQRRDDDRRRALRGAAVSRTTIDELEVGVDTARAGRRPLLRQVPRPRR